MLPGYNHQDHNRASRDVREAQRAPSDPADPWAGEWDVLTGQALRARGTAVISDEILVACNPEQAGRALRPLASADVHIILTVRDFASVLPAEWQESVKCRGTVPWEEWLDRVIDAEPAADRCRRSWFWTVHDTLATLDMWSRNIPPDHVHVITVPPHGPLERLWVRFASVLGIDPGCIDLTEARVNPSLGVPEAEFLRRFNERLPQDVPTGSIPATSSEFSRSTSAVPAAPASPRAPPASGSHGPGNNRKSWWQACAMPSTTSSVILTSSFRDLRPDPMPGPPTSQPSSWRMRPCPPPRS